MENTQAEKWVFIVNPIAGNGYGHKIIGKVKEMIKQYNDKADLVVTERKGHASELAQAYAHKGYKYIIGVGGDGTMNEIARPLVHNGDVIIGIVPAGNGNDFIQILGFPDRFQNNDWKILFEKHVISMDVGECNGKIFLNGMGLGFDAQVASENYEKEGEVKKGGKGKYLWHILKTLLFFRELTATIESDNNKYETSCFINTISIGRRFAGGFFLTPKAIANDGLLDVCMIKRLSLIQRFRILLMVPKGTHIHDKKVNYYQTKRISLNFAKEVPYHVDGELFFSSAFDVNIFPSGLKVLFNPGGNHYFNTDSRAY